MQVGEHGNCTWVDKFQIFIFFFLLLLYCNTISADKQNKYHLTSSLLELWVEYWL